MINSKPKLLLHICCIGCGVHTIKELSRDYDVTLFFYNPNIFPQTEYDKRLEEIERISAKYKMKCTIDNDKYDNWLQSIHGLENEPEKGLRCHKCYRLRLERTARYAQANDFELFTSTLTISPHKSAEAINAIGAELEKTYKISYLSSDFKKNGGFQASCALSKELGLYRQNYCGCEFSIR